MRCEEAQACCPLDGTVHQAFGAISRASLRWVRNTDRSVVPAANAARDQKARARRKSTFSKRLVLCCPMSVREIPFQAPYLPNCFGKGNN
jgi:hypothetical protein